jgi:hypothetical protein
MVLWAGSASKSECGQCLRSSICLQKLSEAAPIAELLELAAHLCEEAFRLSSNLGIPLAEDCQTIFERLDQNRN